MRKIGFTFIALFMLAFPASVLGHEITSVDTFCEKDGAGIVIEGTSFDIDTTVTITGPNGYLATFVVEEADFTETLPLGDNGSYSIDWPESGDFGPVEFVVECASPTPTPTTPAHNSPPPTMPPSDTIGAVTTSHESGDNVSVIVAMMVGLVSLIGINSYFKRREI